MKSTQELEARRSRLMETIRQVRSELTAPVNVPDDGLWRMGQMDELESLQHKVSLLTRYLLHPKSESELTARLRELFAQYDELHTHLGKLPCFDEVGEEVAFEELSPVEREQCNEVDALHYEMFVNHHEHETVGYILDVDPRRLYELRHIIGAYHKPADLRWACGDEPAAECYPLVKHWIEHGGDVSTLAIPPQLSAWMRGKEDDA